MEILIISGMSGAGKSRAAICLEDSGYYIVDNLPAEMMVKFAEFCAAAGGRYDRLAFVYDVRAGEPFERLTGAVEELRRQGPPCAILKAGSSSPANAGSGPVSAGGKAVFS